MLNWVALFASIASGSTLPLMTIIFGHSTAQFNNFAVVGPSPSGFDDKLHGYV
jgi:ATP-binding cassette subfamily B (MDR/TAP) protein 1